MSKPISAIQQRLMNRNIQSEHSICYHCFIFPLHYPTLCPVLHASIWRKNNALHIGSGLKARIMLFQCDFYSVNEIINKMCVMSASQLWHESLFHSFQLSV